MNKNFLNEASAVIKENIGLETAVMYQDFFENKGLADPKQIFNIYENYKNLYDIILFIFFVFKIK